MHGLPSKALFVFMIIKSRRPSHTCPQDISGICFVNPSCRTWQILIPATEVITEITNGPTTKGKVEF